MDKKKRNILIAAAAGGVLTVGVAVMLLVSRPDADIMQKENGSYIINTTKLAPDVLGYEGATPLKIYITNGKIEKVEALSNRETPRFFARVKSHLLPQWNGLVVTQALKNPPDGVTGATYSSKAVKENVRLGLEYYKKHRK
ncbi:MAG: FMN-binding protein [Bacteroidaceae bacterium]|nr:FMN-binding protein [Bacteroidaceae bacterium]